MHPDRRRESAADVEPLHRRISELDQQLAQAQAERDALEKRRTEGPWECVFCLDFFDGGEEHWRRCHFHPANAEIAAMASVIQRSTFGPLAAMEAGEVLAQLPPAARRLLAAQRVAEAFDAVYSAPPSGCVDHGAIEDKAIQALDEWRKAGQ